MLGLYIHIPFCVSKCIYCDFISYSNKNKLIKQYIQALKQEIKNTTEDLEDFCESTSIKNQLQLTATIF